MTIQLKCLCGRDLNYDSLGECGKIICPDCLQEFELKAISKKYTNSTDKISSFISVYKEKIVPLFVQLFKFLKLKFLVVICLIKESFNNDSRKIIANKFDSFYRNIKSYFNIIFSQLLLSFEETKKFAITIAEYLSLLFSGSSEKIKHARGEIIPKTFISRLRIGFSLVLILLSVVFLTKQIAHITGTRTVAKNNEEVLPKEDKFASELNLENKNEIKEMQQRNFTNSIGMKFVLIKNGTFNMGRPDHDKIKFNDNKLHEVKISRDYYLAIYEVKQSEYESVMKVNPSLNKGKNLTKEKIGDLPVDSVNWEEANLFCKKLSEIPSEKAAGRKYRLPTEAEWEFASKAGESSKISYEPDEDYLTKYGWICCNSGDSKINTEEVLEKINGDQNKFQEILQSNNCMSHPVGEKLANAFGLFDMNGNLGEWCNDYYQEDLSSFTLDPKGPNSGRHRVIRGGCFFETALRSSSTVRFLNDQESKSHSLGFRVALTVDPLSDSIDQDIQDIGFSKRVLSANPLIFGDLNYTIFTETGATRNPLDPKFKAFVPKDLSVTKIDHSPLLNDKVYYDNLAKKFNPKFSVGCKSDATLAALLLSGVSLESIENIKIMQPNLRSNYNVVSPIQVYTNAKMFKYVFGEPSYILDVGKGDSYWGVKCKDGTLEFRGTYGFSPHNLERNPHIKNMVVISSIVVDK